MPEWTTLEMLQPSAVFKTRDGVLAIKTNRYMANAQSECTLLANGERAYFLDGNSTAVQEIPLALIEAAPDLLATCQTILRYLSSHQIYDKDARSILERAIAKAKGEIDATD